MVYVGHWDPANVHFLITSVSKVTVWTLTQPFIGVQQPLTLPIVLTCVKIDRLALGVMHDNLTRTVTPTPATVNLVYGFWDLGKVFPIDDMYRSGMFCKFYSRPPVSAVTVSAVTAFM